MKKTCLQGFRPGTTADSNWPAQLHRLARVFGLASIRVILSRRGTAKMLIRLRECRQKEQEWNSLIWVYTVCPYRPVCLIILDHNSLREIF